MLGTVAAGLITGTPQGAETGGYLGAATAGSIALIKHRENEKQQAQITRDTLVQQQQTIVSLQNERARLNQCKDEETPLAQCGNVQPASNQVVMPDKSDEPDWNASRFDLEKQSQVQQDYIEKLQRQIGDLKQQIRSQ